MKDLVIWKPPSFKVYKVFIFFVFPILWKGNSDICNRIALETFPPTKYRIGKNFK